MLLTFVRPHLPGGRRDLLPVGTADLLARSRGRSLVGGGCQSSSLGGRLDERRDLASDEHAQEGSGDPDHGLGLGITPLPSLKRYAQRDERLERGLPRHRFSSDPGHTAFHALLTRALPLCPVRAGTAPPGIGLVVTSASAQGILP